MKYDEDEFFMEIAKLTSLQSHCVSHQVGAVIVKDKRIISIGYNGTPAGYVNCDSIFNKDNFDIEKHHDFSLNNEIHAEVNAILYAMKNSINIEGSKLYVTLSPCHDCAKFIVVSGIKEVIYNELYEREGEQPLKFMKLNDVKVRQYHPNYSIIDKIRR